jgi:predicted alpha/beta superfamily hydrolase/peptidoglycan/xylan/chitin deacetylase (PgdA/CDA1 family)
MARFVEMCVGMVLAASFAAAQRSVAVTIDDLPVSQAGERGCEWSGLESLTRRLLARIRERHVPVAAFAVAGNCSALSLEQKRAIFAMWKEAGAEIGNHTYSHPDLNTTSIYDYEQDILRADAALREATGAPRLRWFRFPMLHAGPDGETKAAIASFLEAHQWRQAPVTFDNSDWMFAYVYNDARERRDAAFAERVRAAYVPYLESVITFFEQRSIEVVGREFPQVLLLHANALNAEELGNVLAMLERRGYRFVSLETALADAAYALPEGYAGRGGFSWIHRWSMTKGMPNRGEPDEPAWIRERYEEIARGDAAVTCGNYRTIQSKVLGESRTLLIRLPADYRQSDKKYPVLYKLDGDKDVFLQAVSTVNYLADMTGKAPDHIVVGIENTDRNRDMALDGGAGNFLQFLETELIPFIAANYRTNGFKIVAGQSSSAVFAGYAFLKRPAAFDAYILSSFGLHKEDLAALFEKELKSQEWAKVGSRYVFVANGGRDAYDPDGSIAKRGARFLELLRRAAPSPVRITSRVYGEEGHVPFPSLYDGLKWIYEPHTP